MGTPPPQTPTYSWYKKKFKCFLAGVEFMDAYQQVSTLIWNTVIEG